MTFDWNKGMQDESTRKLIKIWIPIILIFSILVISYAFLSGGHNKITVKGIETNIPVKKNDTISINSTSVGEIKGDFVMGSKTTNNISDTIKSKAK